MTARDEARVKCIEAIKTALAMDALFSTIDEDRTATRAFDSLNGIAFVEPLVATEEMQLSVSGFEDNVTSWRTMSAAGDLTNPLEKKP